MCRLMIITSAEHLPCSLHLGSARLGSDSLLDEVIVVIATVQLLGHAWG